MTILMEISNDARGWIMCLVSSIACFAGALVICVDPLVRLVPGFKNFNMAESSIFLASSLSLSFGVMIFSALMSMLPEAREYFIKTGLSHRTASLCLMACFAGGFCGIQVISRLFHQLLPSHVVDCDHAHVSPVTAPVHVHARTSARDVEAGSLGMNGHPSRKPPSEATPLLNEHSNSFGASNSGAPHLSIHSVRPEISNDDADRQLRRPRLAAVDRVVSFVKDTKADCDVRGPCYGFSDPCGQGCFKHIQVKSPAMEPSSGVQSPNRLHSTRHALEHPRQLYAAQDGHLERDAVSRLAAGDGGQGTSSGHYCDDSTSEHHHHHVASNAFASIGIQTAIAIAIHKFPEGFITWASNHANPELGFNVFMALFIHNITEGFALAMPLYLALQSKWKAILATFFLGGLSQPVGALLAVVWLRMTNDSPLEPSNALYAVLFAATAGIMVSVALNLFVEGMSLNHNPNLCISFAVVGMLILGLSQALV